MSRVHLTVLLVPVLSGAAFGYDTLNFVGAELLGRPTDRSVTVSVVPRTELAVRFEYGTDTLYGSSTVPETTSAGVPHEVVIDGLASSTGYRYRTRYRVLASGDSFAGPHRSFVTARAPGARFVFAVEADPHMVPGEGDSAQAFELTLANIAASGPDFLIDLGDNFMLDKWDTLTDDTIRQRMHGYRRWWGEVCHSAPLFLALGNHEGEQGWDYDSTPGCRPVRLANARKRFFPNPVPDGYYTGDSIEWPHVGLRGDYYAWEWGNALFVVLDPFWYTTTKPRSGEDNWNWTLGRDQYDWFRRTLESSSAKFKFVFIHHLVGGKIDATARGGIEYCWFYEQGGFRTDSTWGFDEERPGWGKPLHQLMLDNGVDIFWYGHTHFWAKQDTDGMVYQMVAQPGRARWDSLARNPGEAGYRSGVLLGSRGHARVTMDDTSATVEYVRTFLPGETTATRRNGMTAHSYTIVKHDTTAVAGGRERARPGLRSNPVAGDGVLDYAAPDACRLDARLYDPAGRLARVLASGLAVCGPGRLPLDLRGIAPGVYFLLVEAGADRARLKLVRE